MGTFSIKKGELEKIASAMMIQEPTILDGIQRKMDLITSIVFKTATARRPKISIEQAKSMGRKTGKGVYRVSDPNAAFGVPVATGALQNTITKSVKRQGKKIVGEIDAGLNLVYAKMIEFGTSRMAARPFMRPAWNENLQWIKSKWKEKITKI